MHGQQTSEVRRMGRIPSSNCIRFRNPGPWELEQTSGVFVEQVVRPTGLTDPECIVRPTENQVDDVIAECRDAAAEGSRVLITTLTKKMAEDLTEYMHEAGIKVRYLHSDVDTLERIEIIRDLRLGVFDVLIGINLLREGLDIPECSLWLFLMLTKKVISGRRHLLCRRLDELPETSMAGFFCMLIK